MGIPRPRLVLGVVAILLKRMYDFQYASPERGGSIRSSFFNIEVSEDFFHPTGHPSVRSLLYDFPRPYLYRGPSLSINVSRLILLVEFSLPRLLSLLVFIHAECIYSPCLFLVQVRCVCFGTMPSRRCAYGADDQRRMCSANAPSYPQYSSSVTVSLHLPTQFRPPAKTYPR